MDLCNSSVFNDGGGKSMLIWHRRTESIMVIELIVMIISLKIDQLQAKIEKERRRKLKIAKHMREVRL